MKLNAIALSAVLLVGSLPMAGCKPSDAQIKADAQAIAVAVGNIAAVIKMTNPELADKLSMAASSLSAAVANYSTGSPSAIIETAANAVEIALSQIPQTTIYAPLVGIAVAAIEVILANISAAPTNAVRALAAPAATNPYKGMAQIKHRTLRSPEGDFKAAWNEQAVKLGVAPVY